jgi:hypothetical protein
MPSGNQQSIIVSAGLCRFYVNNAIYKVAQSVSVNINTGENSIYGINSPLPQEIATNGQYSVTGTATVVRTKSSGGLQGVNLRPLFSDMAASNYVSLRLEDRSTLETLWSIPKAKIFNVKETIQTKNIYHISFEFTGILLFWPLDLS